jgi:hypothetical protein
LQAGSGIYLGSSGADIKLTANDVYTEAFTDYSATSTIDGWSSYTTKTLHYKKVGKTVFVYFNFLGTSNSGSTTFTMPYNNTSVTVARFVYRSQDNGGALVAGAGQMAGGSGSVVLYSDMGGSLWTSSGQKAAFGQFFYETG